ncbi:hypothetical protein FB45DRAFT_836724 [Roridomyces roridus]|uniref:CxC2-like cysteine cluster KDZ transposase-associated domain-containing protein n=1 Tax=Roridomyces roridus TaxID=1738132 RepID=A0AAD7BLH9_9AGAR|nr:hypothetical protein FB45DRAFT_836724 [Roridomyces roridus]
MLGFIRERNKILDAFLRREGRGTGWEDGCMDESCLNTDAKYRCQECFARRLLCHACIVKRHQDEPLHIIEEWRDNYFQPCSVASLNESLRLQLGHPPAQYCNFPNGPHPMVVLDNNGIHQLEIDFCGCVGAPSICDQLIDIGWYPATKTAPETCATLSLLKRFHTLNLQARVSAYDFYNSLEVVSERGGMQVVPDRREQFTLIAREYRHVQQCKRAGRGHDELLHGIEATAPGECGIDCRACPVPGVNVPDEYAPEDAWLYQLLLSQDANFKLKGRDTSSRDKDPALGPGFAYVVANDQYLAHLSKYISHCVAFAALWRANNKRAKGLRATGIASVSCSRHEVFRKNGTGDLQKGERYSNIDYLFFMSIFGIALSSILVSYDIACQWSINFWKRAKKMPSYLQLPPGLRIQFKVPKFHLPPHVKKCHGPYSFNYTKGVGRTDGEGVERNWSWLNMIARSVSVMGPGSREDTIDDFCGYANWRKTVGFGSSRNSLLRKLVLAIPKAILHGQAFQAFTEGVREGHEDELEAWEEEIQAWEADSEKKCPYEYPEEQDITMDSLRLLIAQEEHARAEKGASKTNTPGAFIMAAMELEEHQETIRLEARRRERTSIQAADLQRKRTQTLSLIQRFRDEQVHFMPGLKSHLEALRPSGDTESTSRPEDMKLHLPSAWPATLRQTLCITGLPEEEERLRAAQAWDALRELRRQLRTRMLAHQFKRAHTSGQAAYTKSQQLHNSIEQRIRAAATSYKTARAALLSLRGPGEWETDLRVLTNQDIRGMNERTLNEQEKEEDRRARNIVGADELDEFGEVIERTVRFNLEMGEGNRFLSWIWYAGGAGAGSTTDEGKLHDDIRIEWAKARARAQRWREELLLVDEEMRRVLVYCGWKAAWWEARAGARTNVPHDLAEGLRAYATEQAVRERHWQSGWQAKWAAVRARSRVALLDEGVDFARHPAIRVELDDEVPYGENGEGDDFNDLD